MATIRKFETENLYWVFSTTTTLNGGLKFKTGFSTLKEAQQRSKEAIDQGQVPTDTMFYIFRALSIVEPERMF